MPPEEWRPVANFPGYEVSDQGRVKSLRRYAEGRVMKLVSPCGPRKYLKVTLHRDGKQYSNREVHKIVAESFIGPCPTGQQVRHVDGNSVNNFARNIKYGTPKENSEDKRLHGTHREGELINTAVLSTSTVLEIRQLLSAGELNLVQIARRYGVQPACISKIKHRRTWKHVQAESCYG